MRFFRWGGASEGTLFPIYGDAKGGVIFYRHQRGIKGRLRGERHRKFRFLRQIQRGLGADILLAVIGRVAADSAADEVVQLVPGGFFGGSLGRVIQLQLKLVCSRLDSGLRIGRGSVIVRSIRKMGQRVHAEGAAGADVDRLQRIVLNGGFGGRSGRLGAEVHVKGSTGLRLGSRRTIAGRGVPGCGGIGSVSRCRGVIGDDRRTGGRLRRNGRLYGLSRLVYRRGLLHQRLYRLGGLYRDAPGVGDDIVGRVVRTIILRGSGQVLNGFFLLLLGKQLGVVGSLFFGTVLAGLLQLLVLVVDKQHHIGGCDGKEEHQPQQEHQQHDDVGCRATKQCQQRAADRGAPDAAFPEAGLPAGEQHFNNLPRVGIVQRYVGEDDRYTGAQHAHQRDFARKQGDAVAGGQQVGQVQQKRPDQIGHNAENAKQSTAQGLPHVLTGHQHHGNTQQT